MAKRQTFYLIDGSSYIFRAFFGVRQQLSTSKGFPTNALYGFINMLQKVIRDEKPDYLVVAFDTSARATSISLFFMWWEILVNLVPNKKAETFL